MDKPTRPLEPLTWSAATHAHLPQDWELAAQGLGVASPAREYAIFRNYNEKRGEMTYAGALAYWLRWCRNAPKGEEYIQQHHRESKRVDCTQSDWEPKASREEALRALETINATLAGIGRDP